MTKRADEDWKGYAELEAEKPDFLRFESAEAAQDYADWEESEARSIEAEMEFNRDVVRSLENRAWDEARFQEDIDRRAEVVGF